MMKEKERLQKIAEKNHEIIENHEKIRKAYEVIDSLSPHSNIPTKHEIKPESEKFKNEVYTDEECQKYSLYGYDKIFPCKEGIKIQLFKEYTEVLSNINCAIGCLDTAYDFLPLEDHHDLTNFLSEIRISLKNYYIHINKLRE